MLFEKQDKERNLSFGAALLSQLTLDLITWGFKTSQTPRPSSAQMAA